MLTQKEDAKFKSTAQWEMAFFGLLFPKFRKSEKAYSVVFLKVLSSEMDPVKIRIIR